MQSDSGEWESFHDAHITHLTETLDQLLPAGYYALNEKALQIKYETIGTDIEYFKSALIYQVRDDGSKKLVTRIELLSSGNKPPGAHFRQYLEKRDETLASGIALVEIDYLHETCSPIHIMPSYPHGESSAYPYSILVSDPHPSVETGQTTIYTFAVDDPIPKIKVPLAHQDTITLDLGSIYNRTLPATASTV